MSHVRTPPLLGNVTHKKTVWDMIAQSANVVSTCWYFTPLLGNVTHKKTVWDMIAQSANVVSTCWYFTPFSASMKGLHQTHIYIRRYILTF